MNRLYIAAIAGLCAVTPVSAQPGSLAPTAPMVPPPVLQNGNPITPAGGVLGASGRGLFVQNNWSPVRSPVVPNDPSYVYPPLPAGVGAPCGTGSCARSGFGWERLKAWLCFHYTPTELPKMRPTPYITPIQGQFGCSSGAGCNTCGATGATFAPTVGTQQPPPPAPLQMPAPMKPIGSAGAVLMPPRGTQSAPTSTEFGTARLPANQNWKPAQGPIANTGYLVPQK